MPTKKAVIVGIEYEGTSSEIGGPFNDLEFWQEWLTEKGYTDICCLKEEQATKSKIRKALKWLVDGAENGDVLFFSFTGHGGQTGKDSPNEESDKRDEYVFTYDHKKLKDDYFRKKVLPKVPSGVIFNGFICACHSGTAFDLKYNYEYTTGNGGKIIFSSDKDKQYKNYESQICLISACRDKGNTYSHWYKNKKYGLLTASFIDKYQEGLTYRKLLKKLWVYHDDHNQEAIPHLSCGDKESINKIASF